MRVKAVSALLMLLLAASAVWGGTPAPAPTATAAEVHAAPAPDGRIDQIVFGQLKRLNIQPAEPCTDAVFLRRAFIDVIGTLPTPAESKAFLQDADPNKRRALIDRLLARDEFADYWAMKWSDLLRVKAEFPINLWPNAAQAYYRWIRTSIKEDKPYDRFVREMLTSSGSNFREPEVNFYRAVQSREPAGLAQAVALTFMGMRADKWPKDRLAGMTAFFSQVGYKPTAEWKEEIVIFDPSKPAPQGAVFPDGTPAQLVPGKDPRGAFADWLLDPKNPYFTRAIANRIWSWLMGRGIIQEPDDIRPDNPPVNPELLAYLEKEMVAGRYDIKHLFRLILNSRAYQLSSVPATRTPEAEANFASYPLRRLDAEVLIDAICQITGTTEPYTSAIPEPLTYMPDGQRAVTLPDGSISSSFLEMFGRPSRDTGLESERHNKMTADQRLHLLNSTHIQRKLQQGKPIVTLVQSAGKPRDVIDGLYLLILARYPTLDELKTVAEYPQTGPTPRRTALVDLAWALVNSDEFLYRH
jgi:hypothetical protein